MGARQYWYVCWLLAAGWGPAFAGAAFAPSSYELETAVLLNDVARTDKEVGYNIRATLHVAPLWAKQQEYLLQFRLVSPKLYLRGSHVLADYLPHSSVWDSYSDTAFYAHWKNGLIRATYLDPEEPTDIVNYKKSIASLFQFQAEGEYNETDVSGDCAVLYEAVSADVFRKVKRRCAADEGAVSGARRVARYTLGAASRALHALYADELLALGPRDLGLKARAWVRLARRAEPPPPAATHESLEDAVRALPSALRPLPLTLEPPAGAAEPADALDDEELVRVLVELNAALEGAGDAWNESAGAAAALGARALRAVREAPRARLAALLERADLLAQLPTLCGVLGLAGTRAAYAALAHFAQPASRDPLRAPTLAYLRALALAPRPDEWVVREALRLGETARAPDVARAALLAAGAAATRGSAAPALSDDVRHALARSLTRCKDEECSGARLAALGNMRRGDTADLLLEQAERAGPAAAAAALDALAAAPARALTFARLDRLAALALAPSAPLELRGAALDLLVRRRAPVPAPLARLAHALYARNDSDAHELRRVLWQRIAALAPRHPELGRLPSMLEPALRGWDMRAPAGTSSVLARELGWRAAGWHAELDSLQLARAGLLRRGAVLLRAEDGGGRALDVLGVRVWARGLAALGGDAPAPDPDSPAEEAAAGLALSVGGAHLHDVTLFSGQAELLGHVWAGTASEPTPVLRALLPLAADRAAVPLTGGAVLSAGSDIALALAMDAQAQASLWYRTARTELRLRAGAAVDVRAALRTQWSELSARAEARAAPVLRIGADADFYSTVALCVRARADDHVQRRRVTLASEGGERRLRVRRARRAELRAAGRTLALGRPNDASCRTLRAADHGDGDGDV